MRKTQSRKAKKTKKVAATRKARKGKRSLVRRGAKAKRLVANPLVDNGEAIAEADYNVEQRYKGLIDLQLSWKMKTKRIRQLAAKCKKYLSELNARLDDLRETYAWLDA